MKIWQLLALLPALGGCSLGARPQDFDCPQADLQPYARSYAVSPLIGEIQRDAGRDNRELAGAVRDIPIQNPKSTGPSLLPGNATIDPDDPIGALVRRADRLRVAGSADKSRPFYGTAPAPSPVKTVLMLSGGAGWGAFGAGFLKAEVAEDHSPLQHIDLVTGVSTGAIQALFVVAGDYDGLESAYNIKQESDLIKRGSLLTVVRSGYLGDTEPLRHRIEALLCDQRGDKCPGLARIQRSPIGLAVGMVEARTGAFKIVNLSKMIDDAYGQPAAARPAAIRKAAHCTAGVVMGSASVPVQMRPVRLGDAATNVYTTYTDGGVRYSAFESAVASVVSRMAVQDNLPQPDLYIVRNGPTVVTPLVGKSGTPATIDMRPDAGALGLQSYSTIVNQTELMSIAGLRLVFPRGQIKVATADGYGTLYPGRSPKDICTRSSGGGFILFDPQFMRCLEVWGAEKARGKTAHSGWITLSPLDLAPVAAPPTG